MCERARRVRDLRLQTEGGKESRGLRERCSSWRVLRVMVLRKEGGREVRRLEMRRRILKGSGEMRWVLKVGQGLEGKREDFEHVLRQVQSLEVL